jgi:hypothetical protein
VCDNEECKQKYRESNKPKQINKVSNKRKDQEKVYKKAREEYLTNNARCERCNNPATEIHHKNGRNGKRLYDNRFFMSICRDCHQYVHNNPKESREKGWLL